ncbi:MAG: HAD family phosphatase [Acutalibacteraceae bacterium]|nr:HAD family phosphatase [Acutalibacteraceae bacterium]
MFSVIFDMDGTLLDTQKICVPAWEAAGRAQGICGLGEHIPFVCGFNEPAWVKYLVDNFPTLDIPQFKKQTLQYVIDNIVVKYKPGAQELLDFLKRNNIKVALASGSSHETIDHHLAVVGAEKYFDVLVGGVDVSNGKPAPDIFLLAAEKLGVAPETCFVFEDSENGIIAGHRAGMKCIGIPDLVDFSDRVRGIMYTQLNSMDEAIKLFSEILEQNK